MRLTRPDEFVAGMELAKRAKRVLIYYAIGHFIGTLVMGYELSKVVTDFDYRGNPEYVFNYSLMMTLGLIGIGSLIIIYTIANILIQTYANIVTQREATYQMGYIMIDKLDNNKVQSASPDYKKEDYYHYT